MTIRLFAAALLALALAACGGGGDDDGGGNGGGGGAGTAQMAASFTTELTKIKDCVAPAASGGAACGINFLTDPVTQMCSDVRTGKVNANFPKADLTKFTATCDDWKTFLGQDAAGRVATVEKMLTAVAAIK